MFITNYLIIISYQSLLSELLVSDNSSSFSFKCFSLTSLSDGMVTKSDCQSSNILAAHTDK